MKVNISLGDPAMLDGVADAASSKSGGSCITSTFDCNGTERSVTTCQKPGETVAEWLARHQDEVDAAMEDCEEGN